ncbi:uncharacterized protein BDZ83DRAFT_758238 [Colletotrichum acutatum]|uniref:Uncharacterized protein n=1 Tax=Glomerella acutata TaxID=27357 RepID=A0AAD8U8K4_GLOAC|nr:uncharacterized protein BDZ83DRAFT_758238 [Colletotrichum acutatum]KAK1707330.1 hypothetical protein BDZ83DRAFT_758238 [Colletotrichum acutatum]
MAGPLSFAASVAGFISSASNAQNALRTALSRSRESVSAQESLRRSDASMTMLKVIYLDLDPGTLAGRIGAAPATQMHRQIGEIRLAELNISLDKKLQKEYASHVGESAERLEKALQRLRDIEQTFMLRRIEAIVLKSEELQLKRDAENTKTEQAVAEIGQALSLLQSHMATDGRILDKGIQQALTNIGQRMSEISLLFVEGETSDRTIDELRAAIQSTIGRSQGFDRNQVVFPFVIPMQEVEDVVARVILDTGVQDNWINTNTGTSEWSVFNRITTSSLMAADVR